MPLQIRYAKVTLTLYMPVCSRTAEEGEAIARDCLGDFVSGFFPDFDELPEPDVVLLNEQPEQIDGDATVWGEAVPEDAMTVAELREHLAD